MCAAVFYATGIIVTDRFSHKGDALLIGIVEVGTIGVLGLILALIFEQPRLPSGGTERGSCAPSIRRLPLSSVFSSCTNR